MRFHCNQPTGARPSGASFSGRFPFLTQGHTVMLRLPFVWLALLLLAPLSVAQEPKEAVDEELTFVHQLRSRGYPDLALEYLEKKLGKIDKYKEDLPLEIAQAKLDLARTETDAVKRIPLYAQVAAELQDFVTRNPMHKRVALAKLQIAQVAAEQGKTQFTHALALPDGEDTRKEELSRAESLLDTAIKGFEAIAEQLTSPEAKNKSAFERGVLLTLLGKVCLELKKEQKAGDAFKGAIVLFDNLGENLENRDPLRPLALAWCGRAFSLNAQPEKAMPKWRDAQGTNDPTAKRLSYYFEVLQRFEKEGTLSDMDRASIVTGATAWYNAYPSYRSSPEGYGIQYVLAKMYTDAGAKATGVPRTNAWNQAKFFLRNLELIDNDYSALAQQLKVDIMFAEGAFSGDYNKLTTFDSIYMRAMYEHQQLNRNEKNKFDTDEKKKIQQEEIVKILKYALTKAEGRKIPEVDLSNTYYLLTGYYLTLGNNAEAAKVGQEFAEKHPKAKQAPTCAMFAANALTDIVRKLEGGDDGDKLKEERKKLYDLGTYMANRWPGDKAGEFGRYLVVNHLTRDPGAEKKIKATPPAETAATKGKVNQLARFIEEDKPQEEITKKYQELEARLDATNKGLLQEWFKEAQQLAVERKAESKAREEQALKIGGDVARYQLGSQRAKDGKFFESVVLLRAIKPDYPSYTLSQYQLALSALKMHEENEAKKKAKDPKDPPRYLENDKREFRDIAIEALEKIPDPVGASADTVQYYLRAKIKLGLSYYSLKKYDNMVALVAKLQAAVDSLKGEAEMERKTFLMQLNAIKLSAIYGKAYDASTAGKHDEVVALLDPLIKELKEGKYPEAREDQKMLSGVMGMALRSNLQLERGPQAKVVFDTWNDIEKERIQSKTKVESDKLEAGIAELEKKQDKSDEEKKLLEQQKMQLVALKATLTEAGLVDALAQHKAAVLQQTFAVLRKQLDELRKKGEKDKLNRLVNSFSVLLPDVKAEDATLKPDVRFLLAECYASISKYQKAIELLDKYPAAPVLPPNASDDDKKRHQQEDARYKLAQVLLIHSLRMDGNENGNKDRLKDATDRLNAIMQPTEEDKKKKQPGWGKRDINALKEEVQILIDLKLWGNSVNRCNELLKILGPKLREGGAMREHYFEVGSFFVHGMTMYAAAQQVQMKRDQYLKSAANFFIKLQTNFPDLGGEENKARYMNFINSPEGADLKKLIDEMTAPKENK
jgi:hypothetical protein